MLQRSVGPVIRNDGVPVQGPTNLDGSSMQRASVTSGLGSYGDPFTGVTFIPAELFSNHHRNQQDTNDAR